MDPVLVEVAGGAAAVLTPFLSGMASGAQAQLEAVGNEAGASAVKKLWALLRGYPRVGATADDTTSQYLADDLRREIARVLEANRQLVDQVNALVDAARAERPPTFPAGHFRSEGSDFAKNLRVAGRSGEMKDSRVTGDADFHLAGAPDPRHDPKD